MSLERGNHSILYSDSLVPDIFIAEYMPSAEGDFVKIYMYLLFMSKYQRVPTVEEMSKKLELNESRVKEGLLYWESVGVLERKEGDYVLRDLKDREIRKVFRPKATSSPEDALFSSERNKRRNEIIRTINNTFFQGLMSPSWYTDIDAWFDRYQFEEDVMFALFQLCYDNKALSKNYIVKVAENWYSKGIRNSADLDAYSLQCQKTKEIRKKICKKLKLNRNLTEYEEELVDKWVLEYKYDFDIIELALKKTTGKPNPSFRYIDGILTNWHENNLQTAEEIEKYNSKLAEEAKNARNRSRESAQKDIPRYKKMEEHTYSKDIIDKLIDSAAN